MKNKIITYKRGCWCSCTSTWLCSERPFCWWDCWLHKTIPLFIFFAPVLSFHCSFTIRLAEHFYCFCNRWSIYDADISCATVTWECVICIRRVCNSRVICRYHWWQGHIDVTRWISASYWCLNSLRVKFHWSMTEKNEQIILKRNKQVTNSVKWQIRIRTGNIAFKLSILLFVLLTCSLNMICQIWYVKIWYDKIYKLMMILK